MVYMAHSDGSHGYSNVNSENYSSQCYNWNRDMGKKCEVVVWG